MRGGGGGISSLEMKIGEAMDLKKGNKSAALGEPDDQIDFVGIYRCE